MLYISFFIIFSYFFAVFVSFIHLWLNVFNTFFAGVVNSSFQFQKEQVKMANSME